MEEKKLEEYFKEISEALIESELEGKSGLKIGKLEVPEKYRVKVEEALIKAGYKVEYYDYYIIVKW